MRSILWLAALAIVAKASLHAGINEWTNVGPEGGFIWQMVVDPQNPDLVYPGGDGGLFAIRFSPVPISVRAL